MFSKRLALLALVIVAIAALAAACGPGASSSGGGGGSPATINVTATEFKYDPGTFTVNAGQTVNVSLKNGGSVVHTFVLKEANNFTLTAQPGQTATGTFTAPAAGTYTFFCDQPGHEQAGMKGTLTVK